MSYDILYNKQFIKLRKTGEVVPVLLSGSNNCFEVGQGGTGQGAGPEAGESFRYYNRKGKLSEKPDVILKNLDADLRKQIRQQGKDTEYSEAAKPADVRKRWGWYVAIAISGGACSDTSWDSYRNFFANGIKHALTIDELVEKRVIPHFVSYGSFGEPPSSPITSEKEYFTELKKWRTWQEAHPDHSFSLSFSPLETDTVLDRLRTPRPPAREKQSVIQDHYFSLVNDTGEALIKYTSRGFRYGGYLNHIGRKWRTEAEAEKYRKALVEKGRYKAESWKVKRIDSPATFYV